MPPTGPFTQTASARTTGGGACYEVEVDEVVFRFESSSTDGQADPPPARYVLLPPLSPNAYQDPVRLLSSCSHMHTYIHRPLGITSARAVPVHIVHNICHPPRLLIQNLFLLRILYPLVLFILPLYTDIDIPLSHQRCNLLVPRAENLNLPCLALPARLPAFRTATTHVYTR